MSFQGKDSFYLLRGVDLKYYTCRGWNCEIDPDNTPPTYYAWSHAEAAGWKGVDYCQQWVCPACVAYEEAKAKDVTT